MNFNSSSIESQKYYTLIVVNDKGASCFCASRDSHSSFMTLSRCEECRVLPQTTGWKYEASLIE